MAHQPSFGTCSFPISLGRKEGKGRGRKETGSVSQLKALIVYRCLCDFMICVGLSGALTSEMGAALKEKGEKKQKAKARGGGMTCAYFLIKNTIMFFVCL